MQTATLQPHIMLHNQPISLPPISSILNLVNGGGEKAQSQVQEQQYIISTAPREPAPRATAGAPPTSHLQATFPVMIPADAHSSVAYITEQQRYQLEHPVRSVSSLSSLSSPSQSSYSPPPATLQAPLHLQQPQPQAYYNPYHQQTFQQHVQPPLHRQEVPVRPQSADAASSLEEMIKRESKNPRKYKCKTCDKFFTTSGHLARHARIHTGERKHECPFPTCDARFARHDNCMQHYRTHQNPKVRKRRTFAPK